MDNVAGIDAATAVASSGSGGAASISDESSGSASDEDGSTEEFSDDGSKPNLPEHVEPAARNDTRSDAEKSCR